MTSGTDKERLSRIEEKIGVIPDFPKKGILFRDIFPLTRDHEVFADCISLMVEYITRNCGSVDVIVGLDARGFIFGPMIAQQLQLPFVPIRKAGKLPGETIQTSFQLEYGSDTFEIQKDALLPGKKVVIVDDLLATGGTMQAAANLVTQLRCEVALCLVLIELVDLKGRNKLTHTLHSFLQFEGE